MPFVIPTTALSRVITALTVDNTDAVILVVDDGMLGLLPLRTSHRLSRDSGVQKKAVSCTGGLWRGLSN